MMKTFLTAIEEKSSFYEQVSDKVSAVSGTLAKTMGLQLTEDPSIKALRERAKSVLLHRKHAKKPATCIDLGPILEAMKNDDNATMELKDLRAKVAVLMMIDSAARPSTLRHIMRDEYEEIKVPTGISIMLVPVTTKDRHMAKDKKPKPLKLFSFDPCPSICTISTLRHYLRRSSQSMLKNDIEFAGIDDANQPTKLHGTSIFLSLKGDKSLATTTVSSEVRKYLVRLVGKISAKDFRHSIPSLIQYIEKLSDADLAKAFRWHQEDTYRKWYKSVIPPELKAKYQNIPKILPKPWKLRFEYVPKHRVQSLLPKPKDSSNNSVRKYFKAVEKKN